MKVTINKENDQPIPISKMKEGEIAEVVIGLDVNVIGKCYEIYVDMSNLLRTWNHCDLDDLEDEIMVRVLPKGTKVTLEV